MNIKENKEFVKELVSSNSSNRYEKLNLKFNPFPMSGSTYIQASDELTSHLEPIDDDVKQKMHKFILDSLRQSYSTDNYQGMTILGDYGSGKTQLLMYIKFLLVTYSKKINKNPFVIYIDNPGVKVSELIAAIISEIGHSNLKKYLWKFVIDSLKKEEDNFYKSLVISPNLGTQPEIDNPFSDNNSVNYRKFIDACFRLTQSRGNKNEFANRWKNLLITILKDKQLNHKEDAFIAQEFFNILEDDLGISSTWDSLLKSQKSIERKEVNFINAIISLLHYQGFTNVFILVDEFEDITKGRLTKQQTDNYLHTLRTLLDKERRWSITFAMTPDAFKQVQYSVPPLAERMTTIQTNLQKDLTDEQVAKLIYNYISFSQIDTKKGIFPFTDSIISVLNQRKEKNARRILSFCFQVIEKACDSDIKLPFSEEFINSFE